MPFICVICRENLTLSNELEISASDESTRVEDSEVLVTTQCGHLFHKGCLTQAFEVATADRIRTGSPPRGDTCPTCNTIVKPEHLVRLYPSEVDDEDKIRNIKEIESLSAELQKHKDRILTLISLNRARLKATNENLEDMIIKDFQDALNNEIVQLNELPGRSAPECQKTIEDIEKTRGGLKRGDKVIWLKENPENGIVKWLGRIDLLDYAGIDFDNPIGMGNKFPESNGKILFTFKRDHGRLIPVRELILFSDYYGESDPQQTEACVQQ